MLCRCGCGPAGNRRLFWKLDLPPQAGARETNEILNWIADRNGATATSACLATPFKPKSSSRRSTGNPHLKAILPATTCGTTTVRFSIQGYPRPGFLKFYAIAMTTFDLLAAPIDRDANGELLAQARQERQGNALAISRK